MSDFDYNGIDENTDDDEFADLYSPVKHVIIAKFTKDMIDNLITELEDYLRSQVKLQAMEYISTNRSNSEDESDCF